MNPFHLLWSQNDNESVQQDEPQQEFNFLLDEWQWPDANTIRAKLQELPSDNSAVDAWEALLSFARKDKKGKQGWWPGDNIIEFLLFCFRHHPTLTITREIVQAVLDILLTLQAQGIIVNNIKIPKSASTIDRLQENLPKPPVSYDVLLFLCFVACFVFYPCTDLFLYLLRVLCFILALAQSCMYIYIICCNFRRTVEIEMICVYIYIYIY